MIERLYKAHGNDLEFVGVILHRTRFEFFEEKQLSAKQAAKLSRWMGTQDASLTWPGAGNVFIEAMLIAQALEYAKSDQSSNFRQARKGYVSSLYL